MSFNIKFLKANEGDSFIIKFGKSEKAYNILVDGGTGRVYNEVLKNEIEIIKKSKQYLDLVIVTHIDDDHIGGILELFSDLKDKLIDKKDNIIKEVWFNSELIIKDNIEKLDIDPKPIRLKEERLSRKKSVKQGISLEEYLSSLECWNKQIIEHGIEFKEKQIGDGKITVLSPRWKGIVNLHKKWEKEKGSGKKTGNRTDYEQTLESLVKNQFKEDGSITNKSSISFILEYKSKKILMLGDAHPTDIIASLNELGFNETNPLRIEYVKISHHGSKANTNERLLNIIRCKKFIISCDGSSHGLPNKECLARIINRFGKNIKISECKKLVIKTERLRILEKESFKKKIKKVNQGINFYFNYPIWNEIFSQEEIKKYKINCLNEEVLEV